MKGLKKSHEELKATRQRGSLTPSHLAAVKFMKALEEEMRQIKACMDEAWVWIDDSTHFRKAIKHQDRAQQRMHRVIKRLAKKQ